MLSVFKEPLHKYESVFIRVLVYFVILCIIGYCGLLVYDKVFQKPPIIEIPKDVTMTPEVIKSYINEGLKNAGSPHQISTREAVETQKLIEYRTQYTTPDLKYTVPNFSAGSLAIPEKKIQDKAKEEGRDEIVKKQTDDKTINYYGITNEKKIAWGLYVDLDKDGSYGGYHRNDRTTVSVGQKYKTKGITSRVMYDVIKH